ncbi:hypothetical protein [Pallidibacillus thermolactis]|jgi:hypothetical protein|uniref:hypothetical protein n=1 Tax=Pallidibacillus thermolactis TaxID=251051 RepID=UPI00156B524E|nr:hypothetical protein [Pallidibacillus thermolactis]MED1672423.1 hypothetical protein [Pallidibacillus thermolactis subsp. kokeshiiformis]
MNISARIAKLENQVKELKKQLHNVYIFRFPHDKDKMESMEFDEDDHVIVIKAKGDSVG